MSREKSYSDIGARIRDARKELSLNQQDFAKSLGIKQSWLSELETGLKEPSDVFLMALQYRYLISSHWVLSGIGPMKVFPGGIAETAGQYLDDEEKNIINLFRLARASGKAREAKTMLEYLTSQKLPSIAELKERAAQSKHKLDALSDEGDIKEHDRKKDPAAS